jgi:hypothetical protein
MLKKKKDQITENKENDIKEIGVSEIRNSK